MDREKILEMDIAPFESAAIAGDMDYSKPDIEKKTHFVLFLRYLKRFAKEYGIALDVPEYLFVPYAQNECQDESLRDFHRNYPSIKKNVLKDLFRQVMLACGWEFAVYQRRWGNGTVTVYANRNVPEKELENRYKRIETNPLMPEKNYLSELYLCWNERIFRYDRFLAEHEALVGGMFKKEAGCIRRLLRKIADPLSAEIGTGLCCYGEQDYQMAIFESDEDLEISFSDMDYNFFIQIVVLDLLIKKAEELFGYLGKEEA